MGKIIDFISDILQWFVDFVLWLPRTIFGVLLDGLLLVLNAIPVPDFLTDLTMNFGELPSGVLFFLNALQFPAGLSMIGTAYVIRFLIRRTPLFG